VNETNVTFVGNVATEIRSTRSRDGVPVASFRIASTTRRFERGKGWTDHDTIFVTVVCWRQLAEHVASSFAKGEPVIATGRLRMRQWTADDGRSGTAVELEAVAAGHDLSRGIAAFTRTAARPVERTGQDAADELAEAIAREPLADVSDQALADGPGAAERADAVEGAQGSAAATAAAA
jgi:single-strand DNA-binding protein